MSSPQVECDRQHPTLTVSDIAAAVEFYQGKLGFALSFTWGDPPSMAGVVLDRVQVFLTKGRPNPEGCSVYFVVGDADELYEHHRAGGVEIIEPIGDRDYAMRDYSVRDRDGNRLDFGHPIYSVGPADPDRARRAPGAPREAAGGGADRPGRVQAHELEQLSRRDPAAYERAAGGRGRQPAHQGDLRHIQELKKKHGIDYDSHGSYRFVEGAT